MNFIRIIIICSALTVAGTCTIQAQNGTIDGTILDKETNESVIGAYVRVDDTHFVTATDADGRFIVRNVPPGIYSVTISYIGYSTVTISDVAVEPGGRVTVNHSMEKSSQALDDVTVVSFRAASSIESVLVEVQNLSQVVSGVSSQQIARSQDNNAAQVMQRIPGITITENRFVIIRGLSERYNNVMINNVMAPSTEVDKRTFSFDLISSGSLDRLLIFKSGSPDLPGDFAGGVIKLFTVDEVARNFFRVSIGTGFRPGTTGRGYMQTSGSGTDFLGFDNGFRRLPSGFPDSRTLQGSARNDQLRIDAAHSLQNNFLPVESTAMADHSIGFAIGRNGRIAGKNLSSITTIGYSTSFRSHDRDFLRYFEWVDQSQPILKRFEFTDSNYHKENKVNIMSNWKLSLNSRNSISFKNLFNQIGENETIIRNGTDFIQRPDDELRNYLLGYRSRTIYTGQIEGNHEIDSANYLRWVAGGGFLREEEPDLRRFRTFRSLREPDANYSMQMPPSSNLFDTGRYFGDLNEYSLNHGADYTRLFGSAVTSVKAGYLVDYRDRDFSSRYMSYLYPGFFNPNVREDLIRLPLDEIFNRENVKNSDGFVLEEGTRPIDSYTASSLTTAGYMTVEIPFDKFTVISGLRVENNIQKLSSRDDFETIEVNNPILSFLPFLNTTYRIKEGTQLRLAYGRTINRPEFRELAPFVFYDYKMDAGRAGNPDLRHATIDNVDLRLELYPRLGETITIGTFFKYFDSPIENKTTVTTESPQFGYINADYAFSYGVEVEIRKSFIGMTNSAFLDRFSVNANGSLIFTKVDLGDAAVAQQQVRPLQGQSPYIINTALYYDDQKNGFATSVVYNLIGPRIFSVGDVLFPSIYEMPRHSLDLSVMKKIGMNTTFRLGIQDVLNSPNRFYQDSDRNDKIETGKDDPIITYRGGQLVNFTFTYNFGM